MLVWCAISIICICSFKKDVLALRHCQYKLGNSNFTSQNFNRKNNKFQSYFSIEKKRKKTDQVRTGQQLQQEIHEITHRPRNSIVIWFIPNLQVKSELSAASPCFSLIHTRRRPLLFHSFRKRRRDYFPVVISSFRHLRNWR